jgi:hypothetical protein
VTKGHRWTGTKGVVIHTVMVVSFGPTCAEGAAVDWGPTGVEGTVVSGDATEGPASTGVKGAANDAVM